MEKMEEFMRPDRSQACSITHFEIRVNANHPAADEA